MNSNIELAKAFKIKKIVFDAFERVESENIEYIVIFHSAFEQRSKDSSLPEARGEAAIIMPEALTRSYAIAHFLSQTSFF